MPHFLRFVFLAVCTIVVPATARALAQSPSAASLNKIGATLKEANGVAIELKFDCSQLSDADYQLIGTLKSLKSISIDGKPMLDRHLAMLTGLKELEAIQLNGTELTDEGYRHFAAFSKLRRLSLFHPSRDVDDFDGSGLAFLHTLPNLTRLTFAGATAGDKALEAVGRLTQLEEFSQWHNRDSPDAIKHLAGLPQLKMLKLGQRLPNWSTDSPPSLTDATLTEVAEMRTLETVDLQEARLTYAGIIKLKSLPKLSTIKLKWVDIPESDIAKLRKEMPNVEIRWQPLTESEEQSLLVKKLKL